MKAPQTPPIYFLLVTTFLFGIGMSLVFPVLPFLVARYVPDATQQGAVIGGLAAVFALVSFFSAPVLGAVSDAFGRRPVIMLSLLGSALGFLLFGIGGSLTVLFLGRVIEGLTSGAMGALMAYIADSTDEEDRGKVFGMIGATVGAAMIVGPALGGFLSRFGLSAPVFVAAGVTLVNLLWGHFVLPESLPRDQRNRHFDATHLNPFLQLGHALQRPVVRRLVGVSVLFTLPLSLMQIVLPLTVRDTLGWGPAQIGTVFMVSGVVDIVMQGVLLPHLIRLLGERRLGQLGLGVGLIGMVGLSLVPLKPVAALVYLSVLVFSLGEGVFSACLSTLLSLAIPAGEQGRVQGGAQAMGELAQAVGPLATGQLYSRMGPSATLGAGAGSVLLALALLLTAKIGGGEEAPGGSPDVTPPAAGV
ncbi:MFS transporter [Deinococcus hopiensis]|uniref:MFS transporter, DHA1 family, tetracycline resistance protein n=1 Tax=Deinococcus hopiensis KR-140 TaxID=695939 RepID=A0A1W1VD91_9DEIO|nr:MFS transporter [Deinococcus hopiensis]SMB91369.1 MFS transporter, DHA1 family, tetracycline resistance protein [Deinococcus hopiensis KR-140]